MTLARHRGFTLVEVLIVIGLITLLASLLFPALAHARRAGQRMACLNNLRQLSLAFNLYLDDHDEEFPHGHPFLWMGRRWRPVIEPYVNNKKIYWCPQDQLSKQKYESTSYAYLQTFYHRPEDIIPANMGSYRTCTVKPEAQILANVAHPSQKILLYEWFSNHDPSQQTMWQPTGTHMALFVDGHVARTNQEDLTLSALGDQDPNWTVGGLTGRDIE